MISLQRKRILAAGEMSMVYDARDRLVMVQDSASRVTGRWSYTQYDSLDRPIRTGLWVIGNTRAYHQNLAQNSITYPTPVSSDYVSTETYQIVGQIVKSMIS